MVNTYSKDVNKPIMALEVIPYTATSISVVGRGIFMYILFKNKSTNTFSLIFCLLSMISSMMWIYYSVETQDTPLVVRGSIELGLLTTSAAYIVRNKVVTRKDATNANANAIACSARIG